MNLNELERTAAKGEAMPDGLNQPEQLLFISLRTLYMEFRSGLITKEQAALEKQKLLEEHDRAARDYAIYLETARMRNRISSGLIEVERNGCTRCKQLVRIFDGRET